MVRDFRRSGISDLGEFAFSQRPDQVRTSESVFEFVPDSDYRALGNRRGSTDTLGGADLLKGKIVASGEAAGRSSVFGFENLQPLVTGSGDDGIVGHAELEVTGGSGRVNAIGVRNLSTIATGAGDDLVRGVAQGRGAGDGTYVIESQGIGLGDDVALDGGDNLVAGLADVDADAAVIGVQATGLGRTSVFLEDGSEISVSGAITSGNGRDVMIGRAVASRTGELPDNVANGSTMATGMHDPFITSGGGGDLIHADGSFRVFTGVQDAVAGIPAASQTLANSAFGILGGGISAGSGADVVVGRADGATRGDQGGSFSVIGISNSRIFTETGDDSVIGAAKVRHGDYSLAQTSAGVSASLIDMGDGNDRLLATVSLDFGTGSIAERTYAMADTTVAMGGGADSVVAIASVKGEDAIEAWGIGIFGGRIDLGGGNDRLLAAGSDAAVSAQPFDAFGGSRGLVDVVVDLGDGNDFLRARGATSGVSLVEILGGSGHDVIDVQSGTGSVDGGLGTDMLFLGGSRDDFDFTSTGAASGIVSDSDATEVAVADVEWFGFDDGVFAFEVLFAA